MFFFSFIYFHINSIFVCKSYVQIMERFSLDGITATIVLDTRRPKNDPEPVIPNVLTRRTKELIQNKLKKNPGKSQEEILIEIFSLYPVKYRITYLKKQYYHPSGIDLTEDDWDNLPTTRQKDLTEQREMIQTGFDKVKTIIKEIFKNGDFSVQELDKRLSRGRANNIIDGFMVKIEELEKFDQVGTAVAYKCSMNSINNFAKKKELKFSDITIDWLKRYEKQLLDEGKSTTTVKIYVIALRTILNEGKKDRFITEAQYPFGKGKYEIKSGSGRKMALTLSQIGKVLKHPLLTDVERRSRDLWFFSYLCNGININDLLRLKYKDISGGEIHFVRQKTMRTTKNIKTISATLLNEMNVIIKKWGNPEKKPDNYIFPFLKHGMTALEERRTVQNVTRLINKKMVKISKELGYDPISTYTARHSFATVLKRSGTNIAFISESLGHTDLRTTENYLAEFEEGERAKNASKLVPE